MRKGVPGGDAGHRETSRDAVRKPWEAAVPVVGAAPQAQGRSASERLDDDPHRRRGSSTPANRADDLYGSLSVHLGIRRFGPPIARGLRRGYPSQPDIQQVAAYALEMGVDRAFLVYPSTDAKKVMLKVGYVQIESVIFDTSREPADAGMNFLASLLDRLGIEEPVSV